jgi:hypothetical protein
MMVIGLPFFALAGAVIRVNGRVTGKHELNVLEQCIRGVSFIPISLSPDTYENQAATLFPLIFSVVVGRALVKLASWKLERGAALGLLEQLMGSRTVGGTIATQFRLYSLSLVAIGLISLWLLSPLGSQAVLRILSTTTKPITSTGNVTYVNTRQPSFSGYTEFYDSWFSGFATSFSASLLASPDVKNGSMDLWNNVKIPYFSSLSNIPEDSDGWVQIPQNNNTTIYSSLFGIPISGLPTGNTTLNLESTYLELTCQNITSNITRNGLNFYNPGLMSTKGPFDSAQNISALTPWAIGYLGPDVTALLPPELFGSPECLDCLPDNVTSMTFFPGLLLYQDFEGAKNVTSIYCTPSQAYVESTVLCTKETGGSQTCVVTAQRLSTLPHMPTELTYLSFSQIFTGLSALLPNSTQQINHIDLLQNYIANPDDSTFIQSAQWPALSTSSSNNESRFLDLPLNDFGIRLGQVINAFLFGSMQNSTEFLTGSSAIPQNSGPATDDGDLVSAIQNQTASFTVPTNITSQQEVYVCSFSWLGAYLAAALAIPLAAIAAAILHRLTKARDYLGYVSSVVRESQFAGMPKGGVNMDGLERTRGLRKLRVRLGDVGDIEGGVEIGTGVALIVGQLAVGEEGTARRIDRRKLYI